MSQEIYFSRKQSGQLNKMINGFESYLPFKENTFNVFGGLITDYLRYLILYKDDWYRNDITINFRKELHVLIDKYYINGFKPNKKIKQTYIDISHDRLINPEYGYTPLETVAMIKALRALRDFIRSNFEDEDEFVNKLIKIAGLLC